MKCKFCGKEVALGKYLSITEKDVTCGQCTNHCLKNCELGKSGKTQGWHFEPCIDCPNNPYNKTNRGGAVIPRQKERGCKHG